MRKIEMPTESEVQWVEQSGRRVVTRRNALLAGTAGAGTLLLPKRAEAGPLLWVAGVVVGWAIGKMLDHLFANDMERIAHSFHSEPDYSERTATGFGTREVEGGFWGDRTLVRYRDGGEWFPMPPAFIQAMDTLQQEETSPQTFFANWGPPSDEPREFEFTDGSGVLGYQRWGVFDDRKRIVVYRTYYGRAYYIPCVRDYADKVVYAIERRDLTIVGRRIRGLVERPWNHRYVAAEDAPTRS